MLQRSVKMTSRSFKILLLIMITPVIAKKGMLGPHWSHHERTSCEEFGRHARFNPYTMPNETWFVFYYWAPTPTNHFYNFKVPDQNNTRYLHYWLDGRVNPPVNWTAKQLLVQSGRELSLMVEQGDRGEYLMYNVRHAQTLSAGEKKIEAMEARLKQTWEGKLVGMMLCQREQTFALIRQKDLPPQKKLQETAFKLNYRCRGGKSYLYQGHHWVPIPEKNEAMYWSTKRPKRFMYDPSSW